MFFDIKVALRNGYLIAIFENYFSVFKRACVCNGEIL